MLLRFSAILAGLSVILGAFAAHIIKNSLSESVFSTFETATHYLQWHALAIFLTIIAHKTKLIKSTKPALLFLIGIILFSGSLYLYVATNIKWLVMITPLGGLVFIISWFYLAFSVIKAK